jgi:hypothetical protein
LIEAIISAYSTEPAAMMTIAKAFSTSEAACGRMSPSPAPLIVQTIQ